MNTCLVSKPTYDRRGAASKHKQTERERVHTVTERRRWRQISHSTNHCRAYGSWRRGRGGRQAFRPRRCHGGELLWLVVEGRGGDFEVQRGRHHERLAAAAGVLHPLGSVCGGATERNRQSVVSDLVVSQTHS